MTCGIYRLVFNGTDRCYIGQSVNIEKRVAQHRSDMLAGRASPKMLEAYTRFGIHNTYEILCEGTVAELDELEEEAISVFNSVENGFNTYSSATDAPTYTGYGYGSTKYSKEAITKAFLLLQNPENTLDEIEKITGISRGIARDIAAKYSHVWLKEEYPTEYENLEKARIGRRNLSGLKVGVKLSAESKGIKYPSIKAPTGEVFKVKNAYAFAREHNLAGNHLTEVLNGRRKSHKGWRVCQEEVV